MAAPPESKSSETTPFVGWADQNERAISPQCPPVAASGESSRTRGAPSARVTPVRTVPFVPDGHRSDDVSRRDPIVAVTESVTAPPAKFPRATTVSRAHGRTTVSPSDPVHA